MLKTIENLANGVGFAALEFAPQLQFEPARVLFFLFVAIVPISNKNHLTKIIDMRDELGLSAGDSIRARVRKAGPTSAFIDPDETTKTN